jgi:hypothetical protein
MAHAAGYDDLGIAKGKQDLTDLIKLVDEVRKNGFARLEFRACRIGTNKDSLKTISDCLKVNKVVGPKEVRTAYGNISAITILKASELAARMKKTTARTFSGIDMLMIITESTFQAFATDEDQGKAFIKSFISSGHTGGVKPFIIGALEPAGVNVMVPGKWQVYPLETEYKKLLELFDFTEDSI